MCEPVALGPKRSWTRHGVHLEAAAISTTPLLKKECTFDVMNNLTPFESLDQNKDIDNCLMSLVLRPPSHLDECAILGHGLVTTRVAPPSHLGVLIVGSQAAFDCFSVQAGSCLALSVYRLAPHPSHCPSLNSCPLKFHKASFPLGGSGAGLEVGH